MEWPAHLPIVGGGGVSRWYQSRQESKRSTPGTSQQSSGQYNKKRNKGRGYGGRGVGRGAISSQGSVRPPVASSGT